MNNLVDWQSALLKPIGASLLQRVVSGAPTVLINELYPLVSPVNTKYLILDAGLDWVVLLDNGQNGTDASLAPVLSRRCGCEAVHGVSRSDTFNPKNREGQYGAEILELFEDGTSRRMIFSANDGGRWKFGQGGQPFDIEDVVGYSKRRASEKFRRGDLEILLNHIGINPLSPSQVWNTGPVVGIMLNRIGHLPDAYLEHS